METRKIILTGGPGSGKSSLILSLEQRGESTVREAAEDVINYQKALGNEEPWNDENFQKAVYELQKQREARIPEGIERVFIDRGIPDGLAYYQLRGVKPFEELVEASERCDYSTIFLIENLGHCQKTGVRNEEQGEALEIERLLKQTYEELGHEIIRIPPLELERRTDYLLKQLKGGDEK